MKKYIARLCPICGRLMRISERPARAGAIGTEWKAGRDHCAGKHSTPLISFSVYISYCPIFINL